jgi:hypothetical protein
VERVIRLAGTTFIRPSDVTLYTAGDEISNSATASSVVRSVFDLSGFRRGKLLAATVSMDASATVISNCTFNLLIFKTANVPAAVGDNIAHPLSGAVRRTAIGHFMFDDGAWQNQLGAYALGTSDFQSSPATHPVPIATPTLAAPHVPGYHFKFVPPEAQTLTAVLQVLAGWNPGAVAHTFGITLDMEVSYG